MPRRGRKPAGISQNETRPLPVTETCQLTTAIPYAQCYLDSVLASRSTVALELLPRESEEASAMRRFVLVSCRHNCRTLLGMLPRPLRKELLIPRPEIDLESVQEETVGRVFDRMADCGEAVWFLPLPALSGALLFVRKPGDDPNLERILSFNRRSRRLVLDNSEVTIVTRDADNSEKGEPARKLVRISIRLGGPIPRDSRGTRRRRRRGAI